MGDDGQCGCGEEEVHPSHDFVGARTTQAFQTRDSDEQQCFGASKEGWACKGEEPNTDCSEI